LPLAGVHIERELRTAFPPARIIVVLGDLVEAELLVVVGADPFGRIDSTLLEGRIDITAGDLLRHHAELGQDLSGEAADAVFEAVEVVDGFNLLAEPATHPRTGIAGRMLDDIVALEELAHHLNAAAIVHPSILLACIEAKRDRCIKGEGWVLA